MGIDIAVTGISVIKGSPEINPDLFKDELSLVDKGPYKLNRVQKISAIGLAQALSAADININEVNSERTAIFLGNTYGIEEFKAGFLESYKNSRPNLVSPSLFPFTTANSIASWLGVQFNIKGSNLTFANGCISGSQAIIAGCDSLMLGRADIAIVGGINLICEKFKGDFLKSGFKQEVIGFLVLERKNNRSGKKINPCILIENFQQGFLPGADLDKFNTCSMPAELEDYCCRQKNYKDVLLHLGNSLAESRFLYYNEIKAKKTHLKIKSLNDQFGNVFSAAGVLGVSCISNNTVFLDVDSYGAYIGFIVNAE